MGSYDKKENGICIGRPNGKNPQRPAGETCDFIVSWPNCRGAVVSTPAVGPLH
jgi:hypothetical protein